MAKKAGETAGEIGGQNDESTGAELPGFGCVVLADRGGVGKTATATLIWALLAELGVEPRIGEVEGPNERKMSALLAAAGAGAPDPCVLIPAPAELAENPRLNARTFAPVLGALVEPSRPTLIDNGATVTRGFLDAAEAADHGEQTDGGRGLRVVIVAKAEDMQSATSAEAALRRARAIYRNATVVLVVTHARLDRQRGTNNAGPVVSLVEGAGKASAVVLVPFLNNPLLGELYGEQHIPFHLIAQMPAEKLHALLGDADPQEARIYRGQYLTWYNTVLAHLAGALDLPAAAERTTKGTTRPLAVAGASA